MTFLKPIILFCLLCLNFACEQSENVVNNNSETGITKPVEISYCELANNPEKYRGKTIILKGVFMLRFEASSFVSLNCNPKIIITTKFDAPPCDEKSEIEKWDWSSPMIDRAHGVVVKGWFDNKIIKGHSTAEASEYYQFKVDCIDKIQKLGSMDTINKSEADAVKKRIEDFEKS